jgi:hypothetical protein
MLISEVYEMPVGIALGAVALILSVSVFSSVIRPGKEDAVLAPPDALGGGTEQGHSGKNGDGV